MAAPKRGLGSGLGALLGAPKAPPSAAAAAPAAAPSSPPQDRGLINAPVASISPNPNQPRTVFDAAALAELQASILELGVLVPIIVRKLDGDKYELIAGERRWRAAVAAGLATIPALVRNADDRESLEVAIIENLQRENLDPLEEAMGFAHLMEAYSFTQDAVAQRLGRSRPAIANALRLLTLSDAIKAYVREGKLTARHARALLSIPEARREAAAKRAAEEGLTVRALEALARDPVVKPRAAVPGIDAETRAVVDRLRYRLATHIGLVRRERGGTIEIRFSDDDELMRIVDLLLGDPGLMRRSIAAAVAAVVLLAAAPAPRLEPVPANAQTALVRRYVSALAARRYADAFTLLDAPARAYFGTAKNFASGFTADGFAIVSYALTGTRGDAKFRLYFVRESVAVRDPARDVAATTTITVPYGVIGSDSRARIKDLGRPRRAFASTATASSNGLQVTVKKVSFYQHAIACVVTFANRGNGFLTLLPYGRSVLRDDAGNVYRPIENPRTWVNTDRQFFLGVHLAADAQVTGVLSFATPRLDDRTRRFTLTVAPNLRAGAEAPFSLDVAGIGAPA